MAEQLIIQQEVLRGKIERAYNNFRKDGQAKMTVANCKVRMENLVDAWEKFETNHFSILKIKDHAKLGYIQNDEYSEVEEIYLSVKIEFQEYLDAKLKSTSLQRHDSTLGNNSVGHGDDFERLPRIAVPKFNGEFCNWENFRDLFTTLVKDKSNISNVAKLHYLKTNLEGDAAKLINSFQITEENFDKAWQKLTNRYENKRRLVNSHLSAIFSIKPMKKESAGELRKVVNGISDSLTALEILKRDTRDDILVYHTVTLLEPEIRRQWEKHLGELSNPTEPPTFKVLMDFLENQMVILEALEDSSRKNNFSQNSSNTSNKPIKTNSFVHQSTSQSQGDKNKITIKCIICENNHFFSYCDTYKKKTIPQRKEFLSSKQRCFNCLGRHIVAACTSDKRCRSCGGKHHTTLHLYKKAEKSEQTTSSDQRENLSLLAENSQGRTESSSVNNSSKLFNGVLLATAIVKICAENGKYMLARALIDQGSQSSFVSEYLVQKLKLKSESVKVPISGVGGKRSHTCKKSAEFVLRPRSESDFYCNVQAYVLSKITNYSPKNSSTTSFNYLNNLDLADPGFLKNGKIDILLGASVYSEIIDGQVIKGNAEQPIAMKTALGWVISGGTESSYIENSLSVCHITGDMDVNRLLQKFWNQEEFANKNKFHTEDEIANERFFTETHFRNSDGHYTVRLPFKVEGIPELTFLNSYEIAKKMLIRMEKKFDNDQDFARLYTEFMQDYLDCGHMTEVSEDEIEKCRFFLPHHGVLKENSLTTKLRTVFNGSAKDSKGLSINDVLHTGENLLPDLVDLILHWRTYKFVFVSDIKQMFRQISIHEQDQFFQTILWRFKSSDPIKIWKLTTVTYGLVSSPFLAIRCLKQLAKDENSHFPLGAEILNEQTYMDDTVSGGHCLKETLQKISELREICKVGGFQLHKWLVNDERLLQSIEVSARANASDSYFNDNFDSGVLGLNWNPKGDFFFFKIDLINPESFDDPLTKRFVLSSIAKLYDPMGWLAPVTVIAKLFMQKLWLQKIDWDSELPVELADYWRNWYRELPLLSTLKIERWINYGPQSAIVELHGFADASKLAYSAVVYLRVIFEGKVCVKILQAKTKVAPIKSVITIPKLELCGVFVLAKLVRKILNALKLNNYTVHLWTDSKDVLYWLRDHPSKWPIFIANRCSKIHELIPDAQWRHVRSIDNPADCASRGLDVGEFLTFKLWWNGPRWLSESTEAFALISKPNNVEIISNSCSMPVSQHESIKSLPRWALIDEISSLNKLTAVMAYVLRFIVNLLNKSKSRLLQNSKLFSSNWFKAAEMNNDTTLSVFEINRAKLTCISVVQRHSFPNEIKLLRQNGQLASSSKLLKLDPILHENLLRVGGRLRNSLLSFSEMHPLILPFDSNLSNLLVKHAHIRGIHGGLKLTLSTLRQRYWIVKGRQLVKSVINKCVKCIRYRGSLMYQKLGNLPSARVQANKPFLKTGVDYAGPFSIKSAPGRGIKSHKGYIAVFVCLSTKAVHLELVSGYDSKEFIAAFRRFTARRGPCSELFSDQGTTFVGADKELRQLFHKASQHVKEVTTLIKFEGTKWSFNPPAAPHFGGIWEAAVKSTKYHLKRTVGSQLLTFNEFYTLLTQIECCLNSRPLLPLNDDITDLQILTPFQLLTGSNSYMVPEPNYLEDKISPLQRWKQVQQILQDWWKGWLGEYLQSLQARNKWKIAQPSLKVGDLVLMTDNNTPPAKWPLAKVTNIYPGSDGLVRTVKIATSRSEFKRPIHKLVLLSKAT